jgi:threonine dehydratase
VPLEDINEFRSRADNLGYEYMPEWNNEIYRRLLLRDLKMQQPIFLNFRIF